MVISIGPAGTGKTFLAMAMALSAYYRKEVSRIVLTRPAIEAGEKLGYLPGTMYEKVNPYLRPLVMMPFTTWLIWTGQRGFSRGGIIEIGASRLHAWEDLK